MAGVATKKPGSDLGLEMTFPQIAGLAQRKPFQFYGKEDDAHMAVWSGGDMTQEHWHLQKLSLIHI